MAKDEDLYTEHAKNVYRYLFSLSGEADTAEELTQETFYRALKSLDSYRGEASPQVWLCAIAKRLWFKELERGINGRYRPLSTTYSPSQRTAGVACINNSDKGIYMLAAYNCRGIYSAELTFHVYYRDLVKTAVMTVGIDSPDFLKIYSAAEFANELGVDTDGMESIAPFGLRDVKLLDESGNDVQHSTPTRASSKTGQAAQAQPRPALFMCSWPSSLYSASSSCAFSFEETEAYIKRKPVLADGFSHGVGICLSRGEQVIS